MNRPYLRKIGKESNFKVWLVDGKYIRDNIDEEFTNFGQHYQFDFIPKNEFWIDKEGSPGERKIYIEIMLMMNKFMKQGMDHEEAVEKVNAFEKDKREKTKLIQEVVNGNSKDIVNSVHIKLLKEYSKYLDVWIVNGEAVRGLFFLDFTQGGHHYVYPFVPKNEVWIDDDIRESEIKFVLLHELHERRLMAKGGKYIHEDLRANDAHSRSSKLEYYFRKHPEKLDKKLNKEIEKNKN